MIRETLRNLPEGLGETYRRILIKISESPSKAKLAQKVFKWASVAKRPLHVEELKEAVAFEPEDKSWNVDKIPHEDLMLESCRGLIVKDTDDENAHFAHHTVRKYLTGGLTSKIESPFEISIENADILAGQTCIAYLSFSDFETQVTSTESTVRLEQKGVLESGGPLWIPSVLGMRKPMFNIPYRLLRGDPAMRSSGSDYWKHLIPTPKSKTGPSTDLKDKYRLLCYAVENWEPHTRGWKISDSEFLHPLEKFAKYKTLAFDFRPWGPNQHFGTYGCVGCPSPSTVSLVAKDLPHISIVHYAAEVGNLALLASLDSHIYEIQKYTHHERYHNETLLIACRNNRTEVVKHLMQHEKFDVSDGRAVYAAATAGHADVLQYLLSLDQYSVKQQGDDLLHSAANNGHEAVVRVLAENGANLRAHDQRTGRSAVESAAMNGHDSVIRTLFQRGAAPSSSLETEMTALSLAAANGHAAATLALLESAFWKVKNYSWKDMTEVSKQNALHRAAEAGHSVVVEILLEHGATSWLPSTCSSDYVGYKTECETPIHSAAKGGHVKVLKLFRKYDQWVDKPQRDGRQTALHLAAAGGHDKTIRWLLENEAHVNAADANGNTPLFYAMESGGETAIQILLEATSYRNLELQSLGHLLPPAKPDSCSSQI